MTTTEGHLCAAILGKPVDVLIDQIHDPGVERDLVITCSSPLHESLDQSVLGELAVLVMLIGWAPPLDNPRDPV